MTKYRLSNRAVSDLESIAEYTIEQFGITQARKYRDGLGSCFEYLADNPNLGHSAEQLATGLKRFSHQSHTIFYVKNASGILIVRVLHSSMDTPRHF